MQENPVSRLCRQVRLVAERLRLFTGLSSKRKDWRRHREILLEDIQLARGYMLEFNPPELSGPLPSSRGVRLDDEVRDLGDELFRLHSTLSTLEKLPEKDEEKARVLTGFWQHADRLERCRESVAEFIPQIDAID